MKKTNYRWFVASFFMLLALISYMDRVNLSVATPMIMKEFGFTKVDMGAIQSAFFLAYAAFYIPGGMAGEYFGPRIVITIATGLWSIFTSITGLCSSFTMFIAARFAFGVGESPIFPSMNTGCQKWFPATERGKATAMMAGGAYMGPIFGPAIVVAIMTAWGWRPVFYLFGSIGAVVAIAYYFLVANHPSQSRFVNRAELEHIAEGSSAAYVEKKEIAPWSTFIGSTQFWAIAAQFFAVDYVTYVFLAWLPVYLIEAHGFSLQQMGFAASLPWIALTICLLGTGYLSDKMLKAGMNKNVVRPLFGIVGLVVCCIGLNAGAFSKGKWTTVLFLTLAAAGLGPVFAASWPACIDLGGKFTGTVSGWMGCWGNIGGVVAPVSAAWIATKFGWGVTLVSTSVIAVFGAVMWLLVKPDQPLKVPKRASVELPAEPSISV
jgi:ACS family glucarate transporter-like MFS transporter